MTRCVRPNAAGTKTRNLGRPWPNGSASMTPFRPPTSARLPARFAALLCALLGIAFGNGGCTSSSAGAVTVKVALPCERFFLPNGLEVVLYPDRRLPTVAVHVRYHVGAKDDPEGLSGLAHLFEHLMFSGSKHIARDEVHTLLDDAGATGHNATTSRDTTDYFEVMPTATFERALWLESDRMATMVDALDQATLDREREVVKNEWRQRFENAAYGNVGAIVTAALYPKEHPYHRPPIGSPGDLDRVTLDDVRAFYARHYAPNNATLVVAGDFDPEEMRRLVVSYFGAIPAGPKRAPRAISRPEPRRQKTLFIAASVDRPRLVVAWAAPPSASPGWGELELAAHLLEGQIAHELVRQKALATAVDVSVDRGLLGSTFEATVELEPNAAWDDALDAMDTVVGRFGRRELEPRTLGEMKSRLIVQHVFGLASIGERAALLHEYNMRFGEPDGAQRELAAIQSVSTDSLKGAIDAVLSPSRRVVGVVTPRADAPRGGVLVGGKS